MNAIQIKERVEFYMDSTRNARFPFSDINKGVRDAIQKFINDRFGDIDNKNPYAFEFTQQVRDDLYTLITTAAPVVTSLSNYVNRYYTVGVNRITYPTNYFLLARWETTISGISTFAKPTTQNEVLVLCENSLGYPTNDYPVYLQDATGFKFYRGATGTLTVSIEYIKKPAVFTIGNESQLINPGNTLTLGTDYIAIEESYNNLTTYQPGDLFNAGAIQLTSGKVILASNTITCDLPERTHEIIAKMAADIISGTVSDYTRAQSIEKQVKDSE